MVLRTPSPRLADMAENCDNTGDGHVQVESAETDDIVSKKDTLQIVVKVNRPVYTQTDFDKGHSSQNRQSKSILQQLRALRRHFSCSGPCLKHFLLKRFPFISILKAYSLGENLLSDVIAGLTVGIMHIPQGIAYGVLANLAAVYGLYVSFFPTLMYFFIGTSRHISLGTFAVMSLMISGVVDKFACNTQQDVVAMTTTSPSSTVLAGTDQAVVEEADANENEVLMCKLGIATAVTLVAGIYQVVMGLLQLGFVTIYLSEPLTRGFTTGCAMHVFTSQIRNVFAIPIPRTTSPFKLIKTYVEMARNITAINWASVIMSVICFVIMLLVKEFVNPVFKRRFRVELPIELIIVMLGTIVSYLGNFESNFDMQVVGYIPMGIPAPRVPSLRYMTAVAGDAVSIAIVAFAVNVSLAKLFAKKHAYEVDTNQELMAYGLTNMATSFFNCYVSVASLSRSLVQESTGGKTQVAGLVSCALLFVVLFAVGPLFQQLPNCVLAAIVIVNLKGMFKQFEDIKTLRYISKFDLLVWMTAFLGVVVLGVDLGLFVGIGFNLLTVVFRTQRPYTCILGRVPHTDIYKDKSAYLCAHEIPGVKIFRFESSLYYANTEHFVSRLFSKCGVNPRKLKAEQEKIKTRNLRLEKDRQKKQEKYKRKLEKGHENDALNNLEQYAEAADIPQSELTDIIIDCTTMGFVDSVGITTLSQLITEYQDVGTGVCLAGCKGGVRQVLETAGFFEKIPRSILYLSIHDAVLAILQKNPALLHELRSDSQGLIRMGSAFTLVATGQERVPPALESMESVCGHSEQMEPLVEEPEAESCV